MIQVFDLPGAQLPDSDQSQHSEYKPVGKVESEEDENYDDMR